jgi:TolA-binding protein
MFQKVWITNLMGRHMIDFETDKANVIQKTENIRSLADQVERLESLQTRLELQEDNMKNTKKELEHLSGEVIPTMMSEMGLSHLKLMDGSSVDVKPNYSANITIANREAAFNWLRNNGLGDIIKNEILVSFGRNEDNKAADYAALAQERGFQPTQKLKVEPMTLKALVRERIEAGKEMPTELFNVFVGNKTTIKRKQ